MRIFLLFFQVFFLCGLLHAQTVKVEYGGDPLPDKDRKKIEQFLQHEVDFYSQFGLPDTLSLQLYVFENRREAIDYLESINVSLPIKASGAYSPKLQKAVILGRENGRERSLAIIYHELSHHFVSQILGKRPPSWLNEGLSEYFEHCTIQHRSSTVRYCGADGKANVGINNDNAGENPARRKINDSPAMSIIRG